MNVLKQKKKRKKKELNPILTEIGLLVNYQCLILNTYLLFGQETHPQVPFGCLL